MSYQDLKMDGDGDLAIENFDVQMLSGADAVAQRIWIRLRIFKGEWYLNRDLGMPYYESIFKKGPNPITVNTAFKNMILNTEGVASLIDYGIAYENSSRTLTVDFTVKTTTGETITQSGAL